MPSQVRLFVSAGPSEEPARELLGRLLAELPANIGWVVKRTPDIDSVAECHLFVVILGADISAPVGLELWWARRTEKPILAFCAQVPRTPACQVFLQENAGLGWVRYADPPGLRRAVARDLIRFLAAHPQRYGLSLLEAESLRSFVSDLDRSALPPVPLQATGAGGGGVILAPGKDVPAGAHVVGVEP